jgi:hypothetical protein
LIRGVVLFIGFGLLYFLFTLLLNIFFGWSQWQGCFVLDFCRCRSVTFIFIVFPIFKLLKLQKGIDYNEASIIMEVTLLMSMIVWLIFSIVRFGQGATFLWLLLASIDQNKLCNRYWQCHKF